MTERTETTRLRMTRLLPATPEEVFDAYTDAEKQKIWFGILNDKPGIIEIEVDLRVGGGRSPSGGRIATTCFARRRPSWSSTVRVAWSPSPPAAARTG
ncbi:SRPBCC domain-containing protein [Streptosporangium lutulentum]